MPFVLLVIGVGAIVAGVALVGFGIPINEFNLGNTLIVSGMTLIAGGLVVFALSFVLRQLIRMTASLAGGTMPLPGRSSGEPPDLTHTGRPRSRSPLPPGGRPDGLPRDPRTTEPRLASSGTESGFALPPRNVEPSPTSAEDAPLSPRPPLRTSTPAGTGQPERKGWLPGSRNAARAGRPDTWSAEPRMPEPSGRPETAAARSNGDATRHTAEPGPSGEPVTVLKSGVVDGMAYTLYTDGSIEAELAQGVVRFGSIEELRNHLEKGA